MCMAWVLSEALAGRGSPADELVVEASATFAGHVEDRELIQLDLHVQGRVPATDQRAFHEAVETARDRYPRACGLRDDLPGKLEAVLAQSSNHHSAFLRTGAVRGSPPRRRSEAAGRG